MLSGRITAIAQSLFSYNISNEQDFYYYDSLHSAYVPEFPSAFTDNQTQEAETYCTRADGTLDTSCVYDYIRLGSADLANITLTASSEYEDIREALGTNTQLIQCLT